MGHRCRPWLAYSWPSRRCLGSAPACGRAALGLSLGFSTLSEKALCCQARDVAFDSASPCAYSYLQKHFCLGPLYPQLVSHSCGFRHSHPLGFCTVKPVSFSETRRPARSRHHSRHNGVERWLTTQQRDRGAERRASSGGPLVCDRRDPP